MSNGQVFSNYARYYDLLYRDKDYGAEAEFVMQELRRLTPAMNTVLELGCGTGAHAVQMARAGLYVDGIDFSDEMLAAATARRNLEPDNVANRISFGPGDARTIRTGKIYDAVVSLFHVMSYQNSNTDLRQTMESAAVHLAPGGLFMFDYWYGPAVLRQSPGVRIRRLEDDSIRVTRVAEPVEHYQENVVDVNYSVIIEDLASSRVETIREKHSMRYLFLPEIDLLATGLFRAVRSGEWLSGKELSPKAWAGYSVMVRI